MLLDIGIEIHLLHTLAARDVILCASESYWNGNPTHTWACKRATLVFDVILHERIERSSRRTAVRKHRRCISR